MCSIMLRTKELRAQGGFRLDLPHTGDVAACAAQGVQTQIGTTPIPFTTYYREKYGLRPEHFPVTRDREPRALTLPLFPGITAEQQQKVVDTVLAAL